MGVKPQASSDKLQGARRWLFLLCQSRAGQCIEPNKPCRSQLAGE